MDLLVTWAMKPTMEKMTNPANMLVHELIQQTMMESLQRRKGGLKDGRAGKGGELGAVAAREKRQGQKRVPGSRAAGPEGGCPHPTQGAGGTGKSGHKNSPGAGSIRGVAAGGVALEGRGQEERGSWALSPVDVVVERIIAPKSDQGSQAQSVGEENLGCRIQPHL